MKNKNITTSSNKRVTNPFDSLFKRFMAEPNNAKDFFAAHLPCEIRKHIDLNHLTLCPQSFVDNKLKHKHVDVLYQTQHNNTCSYLYILTEQQTKPDKNMPMRMFQYMLRIIEMHQKQHKTDKYPIVYPMIFYVGNKPYNYSTDFFDGFGEQKKLAKNILTTPFQLASITGVSQQQLEKHPLAGTLSRIYQMAFARDIISELNSLRKQIWSIDEQHGSDLILAMLEFILYKAEKGDAYAIIEAVQAIVSDETGEKVMTLSEQLINDGIQQGMQQGMQQGIKKGMEQEKLIIAKQMLLEGIKTNTILKITGLSFSQLKELGYIDSESE